MILTALVKAIGRLKQQPNFFTHFFLSSEDGAAIRLPRSLLPRAPESKKGSRFRRRFV
jgi:hypothetical protein